MTAQPMNAHPVTVQPMTGHPMTGHPMTGHPTPRREELHSRPPFALVARFLPGGLLPGGLLLGGLLLALLLPAEPLAAAEDPRFFGEFCGEHVERYRITVSFLGIPVSRRTETQRFEVKTRLSTVDRGVSGTLVAGSGTAVARGGRADGSVVPFTLNGTSRVQGVLEGFIQSEELGRTTGTAILDSSGSRVTVSGLGRRLNLSREACGDNSPPRVRILSPAPWTVPWGEDLRLEAAVEDAEDGTIPSGRVRWTSSLDGSLGSGYAFDARFLSRGEHVLTATAADSRGALGKATVRITIDNNRPNTPVILAPAGRTEVLAGSTILLRGRASDRESGQLRGDQLQWKSSIDGILGTGELLSTPLSLGRHLITLTAFDTEEAFTRATVQVHVREIADGENRPPTVAILSPRDFTGVSDTDCLVFLAEAQDAEDASFSASAFRWTDTYFDGTRDVTRTLPGIGPRIEVCGLPTSGRDTVHRIAVEVTDSAGTASTPDGVRIYVIPGGLI